MKVSYEYISEPVADSRQWTVFHFEGWAKGLQHFIAKKKKTGTL